MPISIRSRLLLLVLSVLLPGLLGVGWLVGSTYEAERDAHLRTLRDTARAMSRMVDGELARRATIAEVLAQSPELDSPAPLDERHRLAFERMARRTMAGLDGWVELRAPGRVLVNTRLPENTAAVGADGPAQLSPVAVMQPLMAVDGEPRQGGVGQQLHAAWVAPVQRNGELIYNVVVTVRPEELQSLMQANPGWVGTVLDSAGRVVARKPGGEKFVGRPSRSEMRALMNGRTEGSFESVSLDGVATAGYFSTTPRGWTYITAMPQQDFIGMLPRQVVRTVIGAAVLLSLAVLGALWVSRRIERPIHTLKMAAQDLEAGRPVTPVASTGIVECDEVAGAMATAGRAMASAREELERSVAQAVERTRQVEQRGSQGQRVEALGRLTGGVAHEFNNLLGIISNSMHLLQRHPAAAELQAPLAATQRAVDKGSQLTQHLLRFSGRRSVRIQQLSLARYLPEVQELMRSVLGSRNEIQVQVSPNVWPVRVDPSELDLALVNLALNAHDAMPGGGELRLQAGNAGPDDTEGLPPGDYVLLTVSDDGIGLEPALVERVFEPFFTTKPVGQGSGLGLSQVYGFAVQAGGTARLASTPGVGTTVSLLLPVASAVDERPAPPFGDTVQYSIASATVLLVEDDEALGNVTAALLMAHGAKVMRASRGDAAVRLLEAGVKPDVVLTDVVMPGRLDGLALARQLRQTHPGLPVVLISGFSQTAVSQEEFTVLRKPCSPSELLGTLQTAIASGRPPAVQARGLP